MTKEPRSKHTAHSVIHPLSCNLQGALTPQRSRSIEPLWPSAPQRSSARLGKFLCPIIASLSMVACVSRPELLPLPIPGNDPKVVDFEQQVDVSAETDKASESVAKKPLPPSNSSSNASSQGSNQIASSKLDTQVPKIIKPEHADKQSGNISNSSNSSSNNNNNNNNNRVSKSPSPTDAPSSSSVPRASTQTQAIAKTSVFTNLPSPVSVDKISQTGRLENQTLSEVSGLTASKHVPGVLYAINDSGDSAMLYALGEQGQHIGQWPVKARNRDWEDLDSVVMNGRSYVLIGDTGDNRQVRKKSTFYLIPEPIPNKPDNEQVTPRLTIDFTYEDGPRNVEAFAVHQSTIYLISKEPLNGNGPTASRLYALNIPTTQPSGKLVAKFLGELPLPGISLESKLAASLVGVDLDHITAMAITSSGRIAYLLTYKAVFEIERRSDESWSSALRRKGRKIYTHGLGQAEALAIAQGRSVFITAERSNAPLWAIPVQASP